MGSPSAILMGKIAEEYGLLDESTYQEGLATIFRSATTPVSASGCLFEKEREKIAEDNAQRMDTTRTECCFMLGKLYEEGSAFPLDALFGFLFQREAARKGVSVGLCGLGVIYAVGKGVEFHEAEERRERERVKKEGSSSSGKEGDEEGENETDSKKKEPREGEEDSATKRARRIAVILYAAAAEKGNAAAQYNLALRYLEGSDSLPFDQPKARALLEASAAQRYPSSLCALGAMYQNGEGVHKSDRKAFEYYLKAAELGEEWGQFNVAVSYEIVSPRLLSLSLSL